MKTELMKKNLKLASLVLCIFGLLACTPQRASYESYRQSAINECSKQPTATEYNNCVERAKMSAEEYRINSEKNSP